MCMPAHLGMGTYLSVREPVTFCHRYHHRSRRPSGMIPITEEEIFAKRSLRFIRWMLLRNELLFTCIGNDGRRVEIPFQLVVVPHMTCKDEANWLTDSPGSA